MAKQPGRVRFHFFKNYAWSKWPFCQWCGRRLERAEVTTDHVLPRAQGGDHDWDNLVISCAACNGQRGCAPEEHQQPLGPKWSLADAEAEQAAYKPQLWQATLRAPLPLPEGLSDLT